MTPMTHFESPRGIEPRANRLIETLDTEKFFKINDLIP